MIFPSDVFSVSDEDQFNRYARELFRYQLRRNSVYREYAELLGIDPRNVAHYTQIPFLPAEFFKTRQVTATKRKPERIFTSSGTTHARRSVHYVADTGLYRKALMGSFRHFYGDPSHYLILALTPSPEENPASSLAYMIHTWIDAGSQAGSGFYLKDPAKLATVITDWISDIPAPGGIRDPSSCVDHPILLLIGITYALLDFAERYPVPLPGAIIMETGGMKGREKELIREEVHEKLEQAFRVSCIHSEYGMSELLSQAYSQGKRSFRCPPWMKILIRDINDPLSWITPGMTGGISIIDLANKYACPFIATQDLGRMNSDGSFEILGRFDHSEIRGCSLLSW